MKPTPKNIMIEFQNGYKKATSLLCEVMSTTRNQYEQAKINSQSHRHGLHGHNNPHYYITCTHIYTTSWRGWYYYRGLCDNSITMKAALIDKQPIQSKNHAKMLICSKLIPTFYNAKKLHHSIIQSHCNIMNPIKPASSCHL